MNTKMCLLRHHDCVASICYGSLRMNASVKAPQRIMLHCVYTNTRASLTQRSRRWVAIIKNLRKPTSWIVQGREGVTKRNLNCKDKTDVKVSLHVGVPWQTIRKKLRSGPLGKKAIEEAMVGRENDSITEKGRLLDSEWLEKIYLPY